MMLQLDSQQPLSSLLSKQSGRPSQRAAPETHCPSSHVKLPGMLQVTVVMAFPGGGWLSGDGINM